MNQIVAVVGMCGSGKSVITNYLEKKGWPRVYFGGVTIDELHRRQLPVNESNEKAVREELRSTYGPAAFAILLKDRILNESKSHHTVLDGLYSWSEYTYLKELLGDSLTILAVVTNRKIRYDRLSSRPIRPLTHAGAEGRDYAEIENLAKGGPIAIADYYITNNEDEDSLFRQLHAVLADIGIE